MEGLVPVLWALLVSAEFAGSKKEPGRGGRGGRGARRARGSQGLGLAGRVGSPLHRGPLAAPQV